MLPYCETPQISHGIEMAPDKTTDSIRCGIWLDPVMLKAIDAERERIKEKKKLANLPSRGAILLRLAAKGLKLDGYEPRPKGKPPKEKT